MQDDFRTEFDLPLSFFERQRVKSTASKVGLIYLLLLFIPIAIRYIFSFAVDYFKLNYSAIVSDPVFQNAWQISVSIIMMTLPAVILIKLSNKKTAEIISFGKTKKGLFLPFIFIGTGVCAFANIAANTIIVFLESFGIYFSSPSMNKPEGVFGIVLIILSSAVTPALVEEFLMRGAVLGVLKKYGEDVAVLVSAILFGLMHTNLHQIPFAFMVGLILGVAVVKTGSIWIGVAIHFINNFMSVLFSDLLTFGGSELLKSAINTFYFAISFALAFVGLLMLSKRDKGALRLCKGEITATFKEKLGWILSSPILLLGIVFSLLLTFGLI